MYLSKCLSIVFMMVNFVMFSQAQNSDVKIEIPGKATFSYDGERIQIESTNTLIGKNVGVGLTTGTENTFLGIESGMKNEQGNQNTFLGAYAGLNNEGFRNVFIGYSAGFQESNTNDKLYIANSNSTAPLIYGDFDKKFVEINNELIVKDDLLVNNSAVIEKDLTVEGMLEIENGDITLPNLAGSTSGNIEIDASGKLIKSSSNRLLYNRFEFHKKEEFTNYTKLTRGVQFADGTVLSGIKALIKDNNTSGSTGVGNTVFAGIYRLNKITGNDNTILPIFRIDANDTAPGTHELFTQTNLAQTGANVIDNTTYIYLIQVYYCDDCGISEVEIME